MFALTGLFASSLITNHFHLTRRSSALSIVFGLLAVFLIAMAFGAIVNARSSSWPTAGCATRRGWPC